MQPPYIYDESTGVALVEAGSITFRILTVSKPRRFLPIL